MDIVFHLGDDWISIPNGDCLPAGARDPTDAVEAVYTTAQLVDDEYTPVDAVLIAAAEELPWLNVEDVRELKALVDEPEEESARSPEALALEEVLSHVAGWQSTETTAIAQ